MIIFGLCHHSAQHQRTPPSSNSPSYMNPNSGAYWLHVLRQVMSLSSESTFWVPRTRVKAMIYAQHRCNVFTWQVCTLSKVSCLTRTTEQVSWHVDVLSFNHSPTQYFVHCVGRQITEIVLFEQLYTFFCIICPFVPFLPNSARPHPRALSLTHVLTRPCTCPFVHLPLCPSIYSFVHPNLCSCRTTTGSIS